MNIIGGIMKIYLIFILALLIALSAQAFAENTTHTYQFSSENGERVVKTDTPLDGSFGAIVRPKLPIRNPSIMAQVVWVDRAHENAIAENVAVTPDGSGIFAGWWLNNERFSSYVSAGMNSPLWTYRQEVDWQLPVDASNSDFSGVANGIPAYIWEHGSPLYTDEIELTPGYAGRGVSFSGDGNLLAVVSRLGNDNAKLLVYDLNLRDTVFTRSFVPTSGLYGVAFSSDGTTIVVSNYGGLLVYNVPAGDLIGTLYNYSQNTAKISGDGSRIAIGTFNGTAILYEWDGSQYNNAWTINTGHEWVTALDISDDGSTVGCGTLDFIGGGYGGKFMMINSDSGTVLIDYDEYGDEVSSIAISDDGQYAIVGSWGQYDATYGDVITCFTRDTNIPIFQLLDDIDEPGSVFDVAISGSGHYAAAGGKAVHARTFGNGGMLYSIKINDPLTNDVAIASIDEPGEFLSPGESVIPTATFINVGLNSASFTTNCVITDIDSGIVVYSSSFDITDLQSFATSVVYFSPDFIMPAEGRYRMEFTADMASDEDISNNDLSLVLRSWHDIKILDIIAPFDEATNNWPMYPIASCKNLGSYIEDFDILVEIYDSTNTQVFSNQMTVYSLQPYMDEEVQFGEWYPDANGIYRAEITALVPDDYFPNDNFAEKYFTVVDEMIYDDGMAEINIWVNAYPYSVNRKFAQRFMPNMEAPFTISNTRFFIGNIDYNGYFDYIGVTKELGGFPDTNNFLAYQENPTLSGPGNWSSVDLNGTAGDDSPLWVILHWPDRDDSGPYIGADETGILEGQSFWYDNSSGWTQYPWRDWMIRMTLSDYATGNESDYISGLPTKLALSQNYPNPFNPSTNIAFDLPNPGFVKIEIFGLTGAKIRTLTDSHFDAGFQSVTWNGKSDSGDKSASGVYYYRLTSGGHRITRKMMLLK